MLDTRPMVIKAGRLIDGTGKDPVENTMIFICNGKIDLVGNDIQIPVEAIIIDASKFTVMPGLIDAHLHISGRISNDKLQEYLKRPREVALIKSIFDCRKLLSSGFTTAKCCGGTNAIFLRESANEGILTGIPRIIAAGYCISQTNGHFDARYLPMVCADVRTSDHYQFIKPGLMCDGKSECTKAVRYALRNGADFIKISTSGDANLYPPTTEFTVDEIKSMVDVAGNAGRGVDAHSHNSPGSRNAILGGVRVIDHGTETDEDTVEMALEKNVIFVSTLATTLLTTITPQESELSNVIKSGQLRYKTHIESISRIHKLGGTIAVGTDFLGRSSDSFGTNAIELELLVKNCGFTPMEAIVASTKYGAQACFIGEKTGTIERGKLADIIVVDGNPLSDIGILKELNRIKLVMLEGRIAARKAIRITRAEHTEIINN